MKDQQSDPFLVNDAKLESPLRGFFLEINMKRFLLALALCMPFIAQGDIIKTVTDFGLTGLWAQDCKTDPYTKGNQSFQVLNRFQGLMIVYLNGPKTKNPFPLYQYIVIKADQLPNNNLHMIVELQGDKPVDVVLHKDGNTIRTMESKDLFFPYQISIVNGKFATGANSLTLTHCK